MGVGLRAEPDQDLLVVIMSFPRVICPVTFATR